MIDRIMKNNQIHPDSVKTRMRYRGPIESYKYNRFLADTIRDIKTLENKLNETSDRMGLYLTQYIYGEDIERETSSNKFQKLSIEELNYQINQI